MPIPYKTNAGAWMKDIEWKKTANQSTWQKDTSLEAKDIEMLEKRKKQKILQNTALEAQFKIHVKKPKF